MNKLLERILYFPITKIVLGIAICFALLVGVQNFISKPVVYALVPYKNIADTLINYISVAVLLLSYSFLFRYYEKRKITELSLSRFTTDLTKGFGLGFALPSLVILILFLSGYYHFLSISGFSYFLAPLSFLVIAALLEDLFIRGLMLRTLENWIGTYWALLIVSLIEGQHMFNDNSSLVSLFGDVIWGFTLGSIYIYSKRVWLPFFFHLGWNLSQPFYGSNLSGLDDIGYIIKAKFDGPVLLTGGVYGIEGSLISTLFLLITGIVFFYYSVKEGKIIKRKK